MTNNAFKPYLLVPFIYRTKVALLRQLFLVGMLTLCAFYSAISQAVTLEELVANNQLTINTKVQNKAEQIVGQPLTFSIEIATNRWFAKGTQLAAFELANTVMLSNGNIIINGSKNIEGQTWSSQRHEITLYPSRSGEFTIPKIDIFISVNTENNGIVEGIVTTNEQTFYISLPQALEKIENFIVASDVTVDIEGKLDSEPAYALGEAITQTIIISAQGTPAMMIPPLAIPILSGTSIYQKPAQVFDKSNRGELLGTRIETTTYVFEQAGSYKIPKQLIYWWDIHNNELKEIVIPESLWSVGINNNTHKTTNANNGSLTVEQLKNSLAISALLIFSLLVLFLLSRFRKPILTFYSKVTQQERRKLRDNFLDCISKKDYLNASQFLYQYSRLVQKGAGKATLHSHSTLRAKLNQLAFAPNGISTEKISFTLNDAKSLLQEITPQKINKEHNLAVNRTIFLNK